MRFFKDFRAFALRGNVIELATAVIVGGAFGKIVSSLVNDVLMPPLGLAIGGVAFKDLKLVLQPSLKAVLDGETVVQEAVAEVAIGYGAFAQTILDFVIIALAIFLVIKAYERSKKQETPTPAPVAPAEPPADVQLLTEIRDLLRQQGNTPR